MSPNSPPLVYSKKDSSEQQKIWSISDNYSSQMTLAYTLTITQQVYCIGYCDQWNKTAQMHNTLHATI